MRRRQVLLALLFAFAAIPCNKGQADLWDLRSASPAPCPTPEIHEGPELFSLLRPPVADQRGHLYAIKMASQQMQEWDGERWELHPCPAPATRLTELSVDQRGRVWAFSAPEVLVWDSPFKKWASFPHLRGALETMLRQDPALWFPDSGRAHLTFSRDGRAAFWTYAPEQLNYFDGKKWRDWPRSQLVDGQIQFDRDSLLVVGSSQTLRFDRKSWGAAEHKPLADPPDSGVKVRWALGSPELSVVDDQGTIWFTKEGRVYRQRGKLRVAIFSDDKPNLFREGWQLRGVTLDHKGNVFLFSERWGHCVLVRPKVPPPRTELKVALHEDAVTATVRSGGPGKHWFEWRLDSGRWSEPREDGEVALEPLANGRHTFAAHVIDEDLQIDAKGAVQSFDVDVNLAKRVQTSLAALSHPEQRERAVRLLVRCGTMALPALRDRRSTTSDDQRWWIDAAIQEIERSRPSPASREP